MTYQGKVENGVVVFVGELKPPDGVAVRVEELPAATEPQPPPPSGGSIWDDLQELAGTAEGLPEDMAENHDHYIHGTEKRNRE